MSELSDFFSARLEDIGALDVPVDEARETREAMLCETERRLVACRQELREAQGRVTELCEALEKAEGSPEMVEGGRRWVRTLKRRRKAGEV